MRIVLDTNILVRANARARGPARELIQVIIGSPDHTLLLCNSGLLGIGLHCFAQEQIARGMIGDS
jgi:hypothetical protein